MACPVLSPIVPSQVCVQIYSHRSPWLCLQQRSPSSSKSFTFPAPSLWWNKDSEKGKLDDGDSFFRHGFPKSPKRICVASTNIAGDVVPSFAETSVERDYEPEAKKTKGYIVRQAEIDEELWAAAWIRAESYCEEQPYLRYIDSYKKKFAEQEFNALKRRLRGKYAQSLKCICLVAVCVPSPQNCNVISPEIPTVLDRVIGTLDLSVRQLSQGEGLSDDSIRATLSEGACHGRAPQRYGYIANVCVTKADRRKGIGTSLLLEAIKCARDWNLRELFVHVNSTNKAASDLYYKCNFQNVQVRSELLGLQNVFIFRLLL